MTDTRTLTKMALLIAVTCISAYISFPIPGTPIVITALTFVMCLIAFILPPKQTFIVTVSYVILGAIGLPVYANGHSGFGTLFGPTGGYIFSWPVAYTILSYCLGQKRSFVRNAVLAIVITLPITYIMGMTGLHLVLGFSWTKAFYAGALPFIIGDIIKAVIAAWLATRIKFAR